MFSKLKDQDNNTSIKDRGRFKMKKQFDELNEGLIKKADQDVLEISSTGYGLESVSKESEEELTSEEYKSRNSCGGL
jgi:hypothetical protein